MLLVLASTGCGPSDPTEPAASGSGGTIASADTSSSGNADETGAPITPMPAACSLTFEQSEQAWAELVVANGDTYFLQGRHTDIGEFGVPLDSGCAYLVTMQVEDGVPAGRTMAVDTFGGHDIALCDPPWEETAATLGTHQASIEPWTMEMHYAACEQQVLSQDPVANEIRFCAFDNGALASCSYTPEDCADGCTMGPMGYDSGVALWNFGFGLAPS